ncbi:hypothetical protein SteCoe_12265 [Stentor coeruleus]|uniref:Palmitoyltransferase n=1 Tax=Stentor coeruleus TaxID=5963 RepID=A0A1R2CBA0_9CILI|nr:hypothetical protein SteCoe_12265 [Stentor coeruleus]
MIGPKEDLKPFSITLFILVTLEIIFVLFICPYLWYEVSYIIPMISLQLFIIAHFLMFLTMITDPGIIPRKEVFQAIGEIPDIFTSEGTDKKKFCKTCQIYRPARSNHCRKCDNCVEVFDHHCPFVNACIGKNNYKYFIGMVISLTLLGGMNIAGVILFIFYDGDTGRSSRSLVKNDTFLMAVAVVLALSITFLTALVFCLCIFHMKISMSGETTKEFRLNIKQNQSVAWFGEKSWFHPRLLIQSL